MSRVEIIDASQDRRRDEFSRAHPFGLVCHSNGWRNFLMSPGEFICGHLGQADSKTGKD